MPLNHFCIVPSLELSVLLVLSELELLPIEYLVPMSSLLRCSRACGILRSAEAPTLLEDVLVVVFAGRQSSPAKLGASCVVSKLTGKNADALTKELGELVYKNPKTNLVELAEEYLSGNVREKL